MAYELYRMAQGTFAIDWAMCVQIIRSHNRSRAQLQYARVVRESQIGLNPLSWGMPDLQYVDVDWETVRDETESRTLSEAFSLGASATMERRGVDQLVSTLSDMQQDTHRAVAAFRGMQSDASERTWMHINESVATYQEWVSAFKTIRDVSGSFLIGAATVATGGAAGAALVGGGLGTALKTTAKYQDTGNLGSALIEASQNIIVCVVPAARGVELVGREKVLKLILSGVADSGKALLEGREVSTAVLEGATAMLTSAGGDKLKAALTRVLNKTAVPVLTTLFKMSADEAALFATGITKKVVEDRVKKTLQKAVRPTQELPSAIVRTKVDQNSWGDVMTYADQDRMLLKLAIVDMSKGIGRSWW